MARKRDWIYNAIDWLWAELPGFKSLSDDTKAILSYLAFMGLCVAGTYKILMMLNLSS
jgi:hypothetical protein